MDYDANRDYTKPKNKAKIAIMIVFVLIGISWLFYSTK